MKAAWNVVVAPAPTPVVAAPVATTPTPTPNKTIGVSPEVERVVFSLPAGAVSDPIPTTDGTVIVRVVERDDVTPEELKQAQEAFRAELLNERRARFFSSYMGKARERMNVEINNEVVQRVLSVYRAS